jgi:hypothetical protein
MNGNCLKVGVRKSEVNWKIVIAVIIVPVINFGVAQWRNFMVLVWNGGGVFDSLEKEILTV